MACMVRFAFILVAVCAPTTCSKSAKCEVVKRKLTCICGPGYTKDIQFGSGTKLRCKGRLSVQGSSDVCAHTPVSFDHY